MQLSKLEIKGFKSFGDKVTINFGEGVTGIVGPNGCGKSNVVDAIRWVLGEQRTRNLRSDKMENVIFNGTRNRRPQQLAEVSLTFLNTKNLLPTEYSEITITRRYYRTGESEYLLNNVQCRLKDINNLFLDTGIGPDSYAIIELKMVDDLLNDTSGSRRELFEEAAGISKFKLRKKETLKKLADTDADLARVDDLLFEIEKNLKTLERQAKQAERYYKTKEEYKQLSIALGKKIVARQQEALGQIGRHIAAENDKRLALSTQIADKEAAIEHIQAEIVRKEKLLASRQKTLNEHVANIRQYESDKKLKNERLRYLNDRREALQRQIADEQRKAEVLQNRLKVLAEEQVKAAAQYAEAEQKVAELKTAYEQHKAQVQAAQAEAHQQNALVKAKREAHFQAKKSLEIAQMQYASLRQELEKHSSDASVQRANLDEFTDLLADLHDQLADKESLLHTLQQDETQLQAQIASTAQAAELLKTDIAALHRKLDALQNEYSLTKSLVDSLEGFPEAVKFLHSDPHFAKSAPLLSDIITCDAPYRVAIENFLQPYMSHYVVDNEAQALGAINLLSDSGKGKAHFFVLESFRADEAPAPSLAGLRSPELVPALDIVEYEAKYDRLIRHLLGEVFIVTGPADRLPPTPELTLIAQSGKLIRQRHSIAGGSIGLFEGKRIGRAKNLEKLSSQIAQLSAQLKKEELQLRNTQEQAAQLKTATKRGHIEAMQKQVAQVQQEISTTRVRQEQLAQLMSKQELRKEDIEDRMQALQDDLAHLAPQVQATASETAMLEESYNQLSGKLMGLNEELSQHSTAYNEQNIRYFQLKNHAESLEREIDYKQTDQQASRQRAEQAQAELQKIDAEVQQLMAKVESGDDFLLKLYDERQSIEQGVKEAEQDYYAARGCILETEKEIKELRRQRELCDTLLMEWQQKLNDAKLQMASVNERLSVEFEVELAKLMHQPDDEAQPLTEEQLRDEQQKCKDRLERIGAVNHTAMEAYNEMKERYDFISTQKNDLVTAKNSLLQTVSEIDTIAKNNFLEAFGQIRENFIRVFRSLFTEEDTCDLLLLSPDDPLESAIDIVARPKGKRPLTINQLSGGEKTLTATSLLFAIYLLRPAPFCIFDEVDAPLDDANIDKFNNIIRKFSDNSQFIIVTHNKRTMASTDVMYGVTMLEQGVSRVVPVDLRTLA